MPRGIFGFYLIVCISEIRISVQNRFAKVGLIQKQPFCGQFSLQGKPQSFKNAGMKSGSFIKVRFRAAIRRAKSVIFDGCPISSVFGADPAGDAPAVHVKILRVKVAVCLGFGRHTAVPFCECGVFGFCQQHLFFIFQFRHRVVLAFALQRLSCSGKRGAPAQGCRMQERTRPAHICPGQKNQPEAGLRSKSFLSYISFCAVGVCGKRGVFAAPSCRGTDDIKEARSFRSVRSLPLNPDRGCPGKIGK